ncbi:MAG: HEAT repeat domain-containing protein, partial [Candidatus Diapherotrites archaeon]|nr:HEAT repeat domain-containing protein [Candidatus Diapherotrites archaeon]
MPTKRAPPTRTAKTGIQLTTIRRFLSKQGVENKTWAAALLGMKKSRIGIGYLRTLAKDPHPRVRATAMWGVGAIGSRLGIPLLIQGFRDPDPSVRNTARVALDAIIEKYLVAKSRARH